MCDECGHYKERQFKETEDSKKLMKLIKEAVKQTKKMKLPRLNGFDKSEMYYKNLDLEEAEREKRT